MVLIPYRSGELLRGKGSVNDNVLFCVDSINDIALIIMYSMARKLRIQYPGAIYHVMNRGDHQERIFGDDRDRRQFLATLGEDCEKTGWQVHSFCLMSNHFHLVIETPSPNLVEGMKWLPGVYTRRFNVRHNVFGHLFSGRYKALIVDGSATGGFQEWYGPIDGSQVLGYSAWRQFADAHHQKELMPAYIHRRSDVLNHVDQALKWILNYILKEY